MWRFWYWKSTSHTGTKFSEIKYNKFHLVIAELHTPPPRAKMKEPNKLDFYPTHFFNACNYLVVFIFVGCCCCNNVSLKPLSPTPLPSLDTCMSLWMMRNFKTLTISMRRRGGGVMISISIEYQMYLSKYRYSEQSLKYMQKFVLIHLNDFLEKVRVNV